MGRCSVRNQPTVTATRCLKVTKRRARACVVCTLFSPKVKPSKGKKKGKTKKRPNIGHPTSCTLTSRSHGHGQSGHGHGRGAGHEERAKSSARSGPSGVRTDHGRHISNTRAGGRERRMVRSVRRPLSLSLSLSRILRRCGREGGRPFAAPRERDA